MPTVGVKGLITTAEWGDDVSAAATRRTTDRLTSFPVTSSCRPSCDRVTAGWRRVYVAAAGAVLVDRCRQARRGSGTPWACRGAGRGGGGGSGPRWDCRRGTTVPCRPSAAGRRRRRRGGRARSDAWPSAAGAGAAASWWVPPRRRR